MHELALAEAVVVTVIEVAEKEGLSAISGIRVRVGELQRIEREVFEFALKEVMPRSESRIASARFTVEIEPARFRCRPCGREFALRETGGPSGQDESEAIHFIPELAHAFLKCPGCKSPDFEVVQGRGVAIDRVEGE